VDPLNKEGFMFLRYGLTLRVGWASWDQGSSGKVSWSRVDGVRLLNPESDDP